MLISKAYFQVALPACLALWLMACSSTVNYQASDFTANERLLCPIGQKCYQNLDDSIFRYQITREANSLQIKGQVAFQVPGIAMQLHSRIPVFFLDSDKNLVCRQNLSIIGKLFVDSQFDFTAEAPCSGQTKIISYSLIPFFDMELYDGYQWDQYRSIGVLKNGTD